MHRATRKDPYPVMPKNKQTDPVDPWATDETPKVKKPKKDKPTDSSSSKSAASYNLVGASTPAPRDESTRFVVKEHVNELLLVTPTEHIESLETTFGAKEAMRVDIVVLNDRTPAESTAFPDSLFLQGYLIGQLKRAQENGQRVVGTLIQDASAQKRGQSAPYRLAAPTDADVRVAQAYIDSVEA